MSDSTQNKYQSVLLDKMACPQCKSKSLIIFEHVKGFNILKTNENGVLLENETEKNELRQTFAISFKCNSCGYEFKKRKADTLVDAFTQKAVDSF